MDKKAFRDFVLDQLAPLGEVTAKHMSGGFGLYHADAFFAVLDGGRMYLRADDINRPDFEARGIGPFEYAPGQVMRGYHEVPADVPEDDAGLSRWCRAAIEAARRAPRKKPRKPRA
jgi:DNA transformation protein